MRDVIRWAPRFIAGDTPKGGNGLPYLGISPVPDETLSFVASAFGSGVVRGWPKRDSKSLAANWRHSSRRWSNFLRWANQNATKASKETSELKPSTQQTFVMNWVMNRKVFRG